MHIKFVLFKLDRQQILMTIVSGTFRKTNAILLAFLLPILLRFWVEAVIWRLNGGPQMLGFSFMHGGAGWLTPVLIASFLATYVYFLWVVYVVFRWLIPALRRRDSGHYLPLLGAGAVILFFVVADYLQKELIPVALVIGVILLSVLILAVAGFVFFGLKDVQSDNVTIQ